MSILTRRISLISIATTCFIIAILYFSSILISHYLSKPLVESSNTPKSERINENAISEINSTSKKNRGLDKAIIENSEKTDTAVIAEEVDRVVKNFKMANIAFNTPKTMEKRKVELLHLIISRSETIDIIKKQVQGTGKKEGESIKVSANIKAHFTGENFKISPITPETQAVTSFEQTHWKWEVLPVKSGKQLLHLSISALIEVDGIKSSKAIKTYDKFIDVEVDFANELEKFLIQNWKWIFGTFFIPLFGWYWYSKEVAIHFGLSKAKTQDTSDVQKDIPKHDDSKIKVVSNKEQKKLYNDEILDMGNNIKAIKGSSGPK